MFGFFGDTIEAATARLQAAQNKLGAAGNLMSRDPAAGGAAIAAANAEIAKAAADIEALQKAPVATVFVAAPSRKGPHPFILIGGGIAAAVVVMFVLKGMKS